MLTIKDISFNAVAHKQISNDVIAYVEPMTFGNFRLQYGDATSVFDAW